MLVAGATFTALLLVLPAIYWTSWTGQPLATMTVAMVALPLGVLLLAVARPSPVVTHFGYFASHLPALIIEPGFTGSEVYSGSRGLVALAAVGLIGLAWVWACRWAAEAPPPAEATEDSTDPPNADPAPKSAVIPPSRRQPAPAGWLGTAAGLTGAAIYIAFAIPAVGNADASVEPLPASVALLVGLIVAWYVAAVQLVNQIGDVALDGRARRRVLASLFVERRRTKADVWTTILWLIAALVGALLWYLP